MRYLFVSMVVHILILSFVWVGLSVSSAQQSGSFTYLGEMVMPMHAQTVISTAEQKRQAVIVESGASAAFDQWTKMRQLEKPR